MIPPAKTKELFVYGTLMRGCVNADLLDVGGVKHLGPARCRGAIYDLGSHPGLRIEGRRWVAGELYRVADPAPLFDLLDEFEGRASFERRLEEVHWVHGPIRAWVYVYTGSLEGARLIPGGSYRSHLKGRGRPGRSRESD